MNARARRARRILRDHRRDSDLYLHVQRNFNYSALRVHEYWACPRCTGRRSLATKIFVTGSREVRVIHNYFEQARNITATQVEWLDSQGGEA